MSNEECAEAAADLARNGAKRIILSHLSEKNNRPLTAFRATQYALEKAGESCDLYVAPHGVMEQPVAMQPEIQRGIPEEGEQCCLFA